MSDQAIPQDEIQTENPEERKLRWGRIVIWGVVAVIIVFLALGLTSAFASQPTEGKAPDFTLQTYNADGPITLSDLRGQVVVVNFWASWCAPCAEEAPDLQAAYENYRDQGVTFLGVAYVDSEAKATAYIDQYGITYPNGPDLRSEISDAYNIRGVPETFIVNRDGEIVFFAMEPLTYARISAEIEKALNE
jgi:cytochrome c biogenesis protein CcmG/thiol:disulfide interchange protein DsbE